MDWAVVAVVLLGITLLVAVAAFAGELAARLFVQASEAPRERHHP